MIIERTVGLGEDALKNPKKYKGFLGISIRNKFFSKKTMQEYFAWASNQFEEFIILLMDDPDMHNLKVFKSLDYEQALTKARDISDTLMKGYQKSLITLNISNIKIVQFRSFKDDSQYTKILTGIRDFMAENSQFKHSLYNLMETNIGKKTAEFCKEMSLDEAACIEMKENLLLYIIEELASLLYFTEKGYSIELDPTEEFETKKYLYEGIFPEFEKYMKLNERGHIFVYPEGTSYYKKTYEE